MSIEINAKPVEKVYIGSNKVFENISDYDYIPMTASGYVEGSLGIYVPKNNPHVGYVVGGFHMTENDGGSFTMSGNKNISGSFGAVYFDNMEGSGSHAESTTFNFKDNTCTVGGYGNFVYAVTDGWVTIS